MAARRRWSRKDKNPENDNGFTPLHEAAKNGNLDICQLILKNIKEFNPSNKSTGVTALHVAAENGHFDICQLIIKNIVDKNPADDNGFTPLHLAAQNGHSEIYGLMVQNAIEKNPAANNGQTPVDFAKIYNHDALFQFMSFIFWEYFFDLNQDGMVYYNERIFIIFLRLTFKEKGYEVNLGEFFWEWIIKNIWITRILGTYETLCSPFRCTVNYWFFYTTRLKLVHNCSLQDYGASTAKSVNDNERHLEPLGERSHKKTYAL